jgi:hypothetical protein
MLRNRSKAGSGAVLIAISLVVGLSGCTVGDKGAARGPLAEFAFMFCVPYSFDRLRVVDIGYANETTLWEATGIGLLDSGELVGFGTAPAGMETTQGPKRIPEGSTSIGVYFEKLDPDGGAVSSLFARYNAAALGTDTWIDQDGWMTRDPCSG